MEIAMEQAKEGRIHILNEMTKRLLLLEKFWLIQLLRLQL